MISEWNVLYIFFVDLFVLYVNCEYPYPVHFEVNNINQETSPFLFEFEGTIIIIMNDETYELSQDNENPLNYSLTPLSNDLFINIAQSKKTSHSYYRYLSENYISYIFPFANNKIVYLYRDAQTFIESVNESIEEIDENSKADDSIYNSQYIILSYPNQNAYGVIYIINALTRTIDSTSILSDNIITPGYFACRFFSETSGIFCVYINENSQLSYNNYKDNSFGLTYILYTPQEGTLSSFKFEVIDEAHSIGIACQEPSQLIMLIKIKVNSNLMSINQKVNTDISCNDLYTMDIYKIFQDLYLISSYDGSKTVCKVYNDILNLISFNDDNKNICGYQNVRITKALSDNIYHCLYTKEETGYLYYYRHDTIKCTNQEFTLSSDSPLILSLSDLMIPEQLDFISSNSGIYLIRTDNHSKIGDLYEIDENDTIISEIIVENYNHLYQRMAFYPLVYGDNHYHYRIYIEKIEGFYIPAQTCTITYKTYCYSSCETCSSIGNASNHKCDSCITNAYPLEDSMNCYLTPPGGYYLDREAWKYKACSSNCFSCNNKEDCLMCNKDHKLLSVYTHDESDKSCVQSCSITENWFFNTSNNNEFTCTTICPPEFSCYNKETRQCKESGTDCVITLPETEQIESLKDYFNKNVVYYYEKGLTLSNQYYTAVLYNTSINSNIASGYNNLTEIELGNCENNLRKEYNMSSEDRIIIAQVEYNKESYKDSSPFLKFYNSKGNELDISICSNTTMMFIIPQRRTEFTLEDDYMITLFESKIDIFHPDSSLFNDKCTYFTENKIDMSIKDRRELLYQNISLCHNQYCNYGGVRPSDYSLKCNCAVITSSFIILQSKESNSFKSSNPNSSVHVIKCYNLVFNSTIFKKNIGSIILLIILIFSFIDFVLYLYNKKYIIDEFYYDKRKLSNHTLDENDTRPSFGNSDSVTHNIIFVDKPKQENSVCNKNMNLHKNKTAFRVFVKKKLKLQPTIFFKRKSNNIDKLDFKESMTFSVKRPFSYVLCLRMKQFQPIYILFIEKNKTRIKYLYIEYYLFMVILMFFFNSLFYSDKFITHRYHNGYNFFYHIPKSLLSFCTGYFVAILSKLCIISFPEEEEVEKEIKNGNKDYKLNIIQKLESLNSLFFLLVILISSFSWYYISAFCGVYQKSQLYLIYGTLFSCIFIFVFPCITALVATVIRKLSFHFKNETLFYLSKTIEHY